MRVAVVLLLLAVPFVLAVALSPPPDRDCGKWWKRPPS